MHDLQANGDVRNSRAGSAHVKQNAWGSGAGGGVTGSTEEPSLTRNT